MNPKIRKILEIFKEIDPRQQSDSLSAYLKPAIYQQVNEYLDKLDLMRKDNDKLKQLLSKKEYKDVLEMLENKIRFK